MVGAPIIGAPNTAVWGGLTRPFAALKYCTKIQFMATQHNLLQPVQVVRGRGSASRMAHRYAAENHEPFDDGWVGVVDPSATRKKILVYFLDDNNVVL